MRVEKGVQNKEREGGKKMRERERERQTEREKDRERDGEYHLQNHASHSHAL